TDGPDQNQHRGRPAERAVASLLAQRDGGHRRGDRPLPTSRRPVPAHAPVPGDFPRFFEPGADDHPRPDDRARHRYLGSTPGAGGATGLWAGMLHLKDGTRQHFMSVLAHHWPELVPRYERAYRDRAYLPPSFGDTTMQTVSKLRSQHGVSDRRRVILKPPPEPE